MVIFVRGRMAKRTNLFEFERKNLSALKEGLQKLGEVKQLSPVVVPTFQVGSLIVEAYDKFQRAGRGFERWFVISIGDERSDGEVRVVEVKGASKVVPTALKILKQLLS
jgi:hypothetical protein